MSSVDPPHEYFLPLGPLEGKQLLKDGFRQSLGSDFVSLLFPTAFTNHL